MSGKKGWPSSWRAPPEVVAVSEERSGCVVTSTASDELSRSPVAVSQARYGVPNVSPDRVASCVTLVPLTAVQSVGPPPARPYETVLCAGVDVRQVRVAEKGVVEIRTSLMSPDEGGGGGVGAGCVAGGWVVGGGRVTVG